jgi:hypothetical protein
MTMPTRGRRKVTEFIFQVDGADIKVPVWIVQTEDQATFEAQLESLDIKLHASDINSLRNKVASTVTARASLKWVPHFYLVYTNGSQIIRHAASGSSNVKVSGVVKAEGPDGKTYWREVPLPQHLQDGDIEELLDWRPAMDSGNRPFTDAPKTGELEGYNKSFLGHGVLLPVTADSISDIRRMVAQERESNNALLNAVRAADPDYKGEKTHDH